MVFIIRSDIEALIDFDMYMNRKKASKNTLRKDVLLLEKMLEGSFTLFGLSDENLIVSYNQSLKIDIVKKNTKLITIKCPNFEDVLKTYEGKYHSLENYISEKKLLEKEIKFNYYNFYVCKSSDYEKEIKENTLYKQKSLVMPAINISFEITS